MTTVVRIGIEGLCNLDLALAEVEQSGSLTLHHYVVTRADLSRGIQAASLVHAAGESSPGDLPNGTHAVVLVVPDESALRAVGYRLEMAGVRFVKVEEDDAPHEGQLMALGIVPARKEEVRRFVSSLPLLR